MSATVHPSRVMVPADELAQLRADAEVGRAFVALLLDRRTAGRCFVPARALELVRQALRLGPPPVVPRPTVRPGGRHPHP